jgi:hypothetical protein
MKRLVLCSRCRAAGVARFALVDSRHGLCFWHEDLGDDGIDLDPEDYEPDYLDRAEDLPEGEWPEDQADDPVEDQADAEDDFALWAAELDEDAADDTAEDVPCDGCGGEP